MTERVWRQVRRPHNRVSPKSHLVAVEHRYGPDGHHEWVKPVCGGPTGRGLPEETVRGRPDRCAKCSHFEREFT